MADELKIDGLDQLLQQFENLKQLDGPTAMLQGSYTLQKPAQENAPVKTGFLRASAESVKTDKGAELHFNANYSLAQEFGVPTKNIPPKGYVRKAIDEHSKDVLEAIAKNLNEQIKKLGGK